MTCKKIKSSYGECTIPVERLSLPFGNRRIFSVLWNHALVNADGRKHSVPAGAIYVTNDELARRTDGRIADQLVRGGVYDLSRMCGHIENGSVREGENLMAFIADTCATADFLCASGYMDAEMLGELMRRIDVLQADMGEPKRAEEKVTAAVRLANAKRLRTEGQNRIAPAARCAYAAAQHIAKRLDNTVFGVNRYFSAQSVRVYRVIAPQEMAIRRTWNYFVKAPTSGSSQTDGWDKAVQRLKRAGAHQIRGTIQDQTIAFMGMELRPYRDLAQNVVRHLRYLNQDLVNMDLVQANQTVNGLARTLRRMVMIRVLEKDLIGPISRVVEARQRKRIEPLPQSFFANFAKVAGRVAKLTGNDLDAEVLLAVQLGFESAGAHLAMRKPTDCKNALKGIVDDLAEVRHPGQQSLPFIQAS